MNMGDKPGVMENEPADVELKKLVLQLNYADEHGHVVITPEDQDRYSMRVRTVIDACARAAKAERYEPQFAFLVQRLGRWLLDRADTQAAFLTMRDGRLLFLVVRSEPSYSREFEDALSAFDIELAGDTDLSLIRVDTMALPPASEQALSSFLNPDFAVALRG